MTVHVGLALGKSSCLFGVTQMQENLIDGAARPGALRALEEARIANTWQHYYEDRGYQLWGFSPSPTARLLAQAVLDSNPRRSERVEIVDWGCGYGRDSLYLLELGFDIIGIDVSERLLLWHAPPTSNVRQAVYPCWAAPVFMPAICTQFSSAEQSNECMPFSLTESSIR